MIWCAARLFRGRPVHASRRYSGRTFGWPRASVRPCWVGRIAIVVSAPIVAGYTILAASELRLERRKSLICRWPAIFVPMLHGAIFLFPVALATLSPGGDGIHSLARGWIVVFAVEVVLYLVGTALIMLILAKDRTVHVYRDAAATDALTGLLNRRGFFEAAATLIAQSPQRAASRLRPRSFQIDQRPLRACGGSRSPAIVCKGRTRDAARKRYRRAPGRRGIRRSPARHAYGGRDGRRTRAIGFRRGKYRSQHRLRRAVGRGGFCHYARRPSPLSHQGERTRPGQVC
jgi:hypothetical protein